MTQTERTGGTRVALFVRETLPDPAQRRAERVSERLADLSEADAIEAYDVYRWEKRIRRRDCEASVSRDLYNAFARWADEEEVRLTPFFETRECYSMDTGAKREWLVFPAMCLVVYEDGDLASVFPHAEADDYRSVTDALDLLDAHTPAEARVEQKPLRTAD